MWGWLWGSKSTEQKDEAPDAMEAINKTSESVDALGARRMQSLRKAHELQMEAKDCKDKTRALSIMKRREMYIRQAQMLEGQIQNLEQQAMAVESAAVSADIVKTMKQGSETMKHLVKTVDVNEVEQITDDMQENMQDVQEINRALSRPINIMGGDEDPEEEEARLMKEMESWNEVEHLEEADKIMKDFPKMPEKSSNNDNNTNNRGGHLKARITIK
jgi:hypothetical protein